MEICHSNAHRICLFFGRMQDLSYKKLTNYIEINVISKQI